MNCVIFCGGFGTRMNNGEPGFLKPLIEVAGKEILAHIISIYESQNVTNFILLGGYKIDDLYDFAKKYSNSKIKINVIDTGSGTGRDGQITGDKGRGLVARSQVIRDGAIGAADVLGERDGAGLIDVVVRLEQDAAAVGVVRDRPDLIDAA